MTLTSVCALHPLSVYLSSSALELATALLIPSSPPACIPPSCTPIPVALNLTLPPSPKSPGGVGILPPPRPLQPRNLVHLPLHPAPLSLLLLLAPSVPFPLLLFPTLALSVPAVVLPCCPLPPCLLTPTAPLQRVVTVGVQRVPPSPANNVSLVPSLLPLFHHVPHPPSTCHCHYHQPH